MDDFPDERRYAWRMLHAARLAQETTDLLNGSPVGRDEIADLLDRALDAGLDRVEIISELADLGARFFTLCTPATGRAAAELLGPDCEAEEAISV